MIAGVKALPAVEHVAYTSLLPFTSQGNTSGFTVEGMTLAHAVTQRSREIGLRIALGAAPRAVVMMIASRGLALALLGLVIGVAAAWTITRAMTGVLYGVRANDPTTVASAIGLLGTVTLVACVVPAAPAARVDPMVVLREG